MKKFLGILMSLIMCFSLVGCGKQKLTMNGIYANDKWNTISSEVKGTLVLNDDDWTSGSIVIDLGDDVYEYELKNGEKDGENTYWDCYQKDSSATFRAIGGYSDNGAVIILLINTSTYSQVGFSFKK